MVSNPCLLAASGGDTIKLFDISANSGDPFVLSYTPSPGRAVNSVKWNHTNLVLASAGDDKNISLWSKNEQSVGTVPVTGKNGGDSAEECLSAISFSNKGSRYLCSGGTGKIVKIWDLQKKLCIKQLKGHTSTITGVMYNCKDEHLASVSDSGDLIVHNLASGARATKLKDPDGQALTLLDYSRFSRHLLVTAGDDGTVHLWDTTRRSPKMSWEIQHTAPTAGVCFSPSNEKIIASVGMDKKLYTYDSGSRKPLSCIAYEAPFSSLAFGDNGYILAAGTSDGKVVVYDVRGKPQPVTILKAFKKDVKSLSWQTSKPVIVNEENYTSEMALFGSTVEDSVVNPDPLPSTAPSALAPGSRGASTSTMNASSAEQTPNRTHLRPGRPPSRQHIANENLNDDMGDFSPVIDVQSVEELADSEGLNNNHSSSLPSSSRVFSSGDDGHGQQMFTQDDMRAGSTRPTASSRSEDSALTPPGAWGGNGFSHPHPPSRLAVSSTSASTSGSTFSSSRDSPFSLGQTNLANISSEFLGNRDISSASEASSSMTNNNLTSRPLFTQGITAPGNIDSPRQSLNRRSYAERISNTSSFSDGATLTLLPRPETVVVTEAGAIPQMNGRLEQSQTDQQQVMGSNNFRLQLSQRTLEETLDSFRNSIHDDVRNLHTELLRQFHMHEMEMSNLLNRILENQAEQMNELELLRRENQELRQRL